MNISNIYKNKFAPVIIIAGLLVLAGVVAITRRSETPSSTILAPGKVLVHGTMSCLPHNPINGVSTLECAVGFQDDKGLYYILDDAEFGNRNVRGVHANTAVTIEGNLVPRKYDPNARYYGAGIIKVKKITADPGQSLPEPFNPPPPKSYSK